MTIKPQKKIISNFERGVAQDFIKLLEKVSSKPSVLIALGGGNTPRKYHHEIVRIIERENYNINFQNIYFTPSDERHVSLSHSSSNSQMIIETLLEPLGIVDQFIYPEYCFNLNEFYRGYLEKINSFTGEFALALLGIGTDGHTASLYPFEENTTEENVIKVVSGHDGLSRVSLSEIYLNKFKEKWFIANSKEKKNAFEYALKDEKNYQPLKKLAGKGTCVYVGK